MPVLVKPVMVFLLGPVFAIAVRLRLQPTSVYCGLVGDWADRDVAGYVGVFPGLSSALSYWLLLLLAVWLVPAPTPALSGRPVEDDEGYAHDHEDDPEHRKHGRLEKHQKLGCGCAEKQSPKKTIN